MIEGLKVTINGTELRELCLKQAAHHRERMEVYVRELEAMEANQIGHMEYSGGDPKKVLKDKRQEHEEEADELDFIARHILVTEEYRLDSTGLRKLGITRRYW